MNNSETGPILTCKRKCTSRGLSPLCYGNCTKFQLPLLLPHTTRQTTKAELMRSIVKKKKKPSRSRISDLANTQRSQSLIIWLVSRSKLVNESSSSNHECQVPGATLVLTLENLCINRDRERHVNLSVQVIPVRRTR